MPHVLLYLLAVVAANLLAAHFGPSATVVTAFLLIGLTLTLRDRIHDAWNGRHLTARMGALILTGAAISYALNRDAGAIALASFVAFTAAEAVDTGIYHALRNRPWLQRTNASNIAAAAVDSLIFPTLAFGGLLWPIVLGQFVAKTLGGSLWSVVLRPRIAAPVVAVILVVVFAVPVHGQIVSVSVGALRTANSTDPVVEVYTAAPPLVGFRPYTIVSWTPLHRPSVITQIAYTVAANPIGYATIDAGANWLAFRDYRPEPTVGARVAAFLPHQFQSAALISIEPRQEWARSYVVAISRTILYRR
jgi:queuosine precursor transporter